MRWPLCLEYAINVWNRIPSKVDGLSPKEKWSGTKSDHHELRRLHPWGCLVHVLEPTLQDGKKLPEWKPKSQQGKFLGITLIHASNVALILNRKTTRISAQFHVLFDDFFTTVKGIEMTQSPDLDSFDWQKFISTHCTEHYFNDTESNITLQDTWEPDTITPQPQREKVVTDDSDLVAPSWNRRPNNCVPMEHSTLSDQQRESEEQAPVVNDNDSDSCIPTSSDFEDDNFLDEPSPESSDNNNNLPTTRSGRVPRLNRRYFNEDFVNVANVDDYALRCHCSLAEAEFYLKRKIDGFERDANFINCVDSSVNLLLITEEACTIRPSSKS